jgi:hypothetical protein
VSGYYKDISGEVLLTEYIDGDRNIDYFVSQPNRYRDIRGAEITVNKNRGKWIQGFINYTFDVRSRGYFGYQQYDINPLTQREYERRQFKQTKPLPAPFARANLLFSTPSDLGFGSEGLSLLGDWSVATTVSWSAGSYFTFPTVPETGEPLILGKENNFQWRDNFNVNMRVAKNFKVFGADLQLFADITNLFNNRRFTEFGFYNREDYELYIRSLHLPDEIAGDPVSQPLRYPNVPGDDRPGDYRRDGVSFQPIEVVTTFAQLGLTPQSNSTRPFYYVADRQTYYQLVNGNWQEVDSGRLQQVLDDKAYIDMPNLDTFTFLNPRNIFFGVRLSFDL